MPSSHQHLAPSDGQRTAWQQTAASLLEHLEQQPLVAERMRHIAASFVGAPYLANGLIGGPQQQEQLVLQLDGFDCVTFVENVLALALATSCSDYPQQLTQLRYRGGQVQWQQRLHYFFDWLDWQIERGVLTQLPAELPWLRCDKNLHLIQTLPSRQVRLTLLPEDQLLAQAHRVHDGTVVAFGSSRDGLDFFHVGLLFWQESAEQTQQKLLLYHASRSAGGVLAQPLSSFLRQNDTTGLGFAALNYPR